jgi:hypothetical protein
MKTRKTIYTGKLPTSKIRTINLFGFSFNTATNLNWKEKLKRSEKYFWILSKFFKHTRRKQEK